MLALSLACRASPSPDGSPLTPLATPGDDVVNAVIADGDGLVLAGYLATPAGDADATLTRVGPDGHVVWMRRYGGAGDDRAWGVERLPDGFIVVGWEDAGARKGEDAFLLRTDPRGRERWRRTFGGEANERATDVVRLRDGGFALVIQTGEPAGCIPSASGDPPCDDIHAAVLAVGPDGRTRWRHVVDGPGIDRLFYLDITPDDHILAAGLTTRAPGADTDMLVVRIDRWGRSLWQRSFGGAGNETNHGLVSTADGGAALAGYSSTGASGPNDGVLIRIDGSGEALWTRSFGGGGDDRVINLARASDGGFAIAGYTSGDTADGWDAYLARFDVEGEQLWLRTYGGPGNQFGNAALELPGGWALAGFVDSGPGGGRDGMLMFVDETGRVAGVPATGSASS